VSVSALRDATLRLRLPGAVFVPWPFGHALGEPFTRAQQLTVIRDAPAALYATAPGTLVEPGSRWRRERHAEPERWDLGLEPGAT
jgi:D-proline reductase (dithiol) PrdB